LAHCGGVGGGGSQLDSIAVSLFTNRETVMLSSLNPIPELLGVYFPQKKSIRDAGSTADFRILFEIFEI